MSWIRRSSEPVKLSKSIVSYDFEEDADDGTSTFSEDSVRVPKRKTECSIVLLPSRRDIAYVNQSSLY